MSPFWRRKSSLPITLLLPNNYSPEHIVDLLFSFFTLLCLSEYKLDCG
uniref:Uncharacterized protein n=1 Tax=Arundo donax TaxID=35708 RepID=A0A0A8XNJ9_ARUDO